MCVNVTLSKTKMNLISKRTDELSVATGDIASFLLDHGVGVDVLPKVKVGNLLLYLDD